MDIEEIIKKHNPEWESENFEDWKITEIMYCKLGWCIDYLDGSDELIEQLFYLYKASSRTCKF
jgi:hypothetical protein